MTYIDEAIGPRFAPPDPAVEIAKAEAKAALLAALPEGAITPEQMDLLFGSTAP